MTISEIKKSLDSQIGSMQVNGHSYKFFVVHPQAYNHIKYSCTSEDQDLRFVKGKVYYKGFLICKA